jgi:hypothetical protein
MTFPPESTAVYQVARLIKNDANPLHVGARHTLPLAKMVY